MRQALQKAMPKALRKAMLIITKLQSLQNLEKIQIMDHGTYINNKINR